MADINRTTEEWAARLGGYLRDARIVRGLEQEQLASRASISRVSLSRLENGHPTGVATLIKTVRALGLTDWLDALDETGGEVSPLALARERRNQPPKRQRVRNPRKPR